MTLRKQLKKCTMSNGSSRRPTKLPDVNRQTTRTASQAPSNTPKANMLTRMNTANKHRIKISLPSNRLRMQTTKLRISCTRA